MTNKIMRKLQFAFLKRENQRLRYKIDKLQACNNLSKKLLELNRKQRGCIDCSLQINFSKIMGIDSKRIFTPLAPALLKTEHAPLDLKE